MCVHAIFLKYWSIWLPITWAITRLPNRQDLRFVRFVTLYTAIKFAREGVNMHRHADKVVERVKCSFRACLCAPGELDWRILAGRHMPPPHIGTGRLPPALSLAGDTPTDKGNPPANVSDYTHALNTHKNNKQ